MLARASNSWTTGGASRLGVRMSLDFGVGAGRSIALEVFGRVKSRGETSIVLRGRALSGCDTGSAFFTWAPACTLESVVGPAGANGVRARVACWGLLAKDWPGDGAGENAGLTGRCAVETRIGSSRVLTARVKSGGEGGFAGAEDTSARFTNAGVRVALSSFAFTCDTETVGLFAGAFWGVKRSANATPVVDLSTEPPGCSGAAKAGFGALIVDPVISRLICGNPAKLRI